MDDFAAKRQALLESGVRMMDPDTVYVEAGVTVGAGTLLLPGTILRGNTVVGENCEIGPNTILTDCTVGDGAVINSSQCNESTIEAGAHVGPFAYIRPNCHVGRDVKVGDFVELKNSTIGDGTKIAHLTYVGDADVGRRVNFGAARCWSTMTATGSTVPPLGMTASLAATPTWSPRSMWGTGPIPPPAPRLRRMCPPTPWPSPGPVRWRSLAGRQPTGPRRRGSEPSLRRGAAGPECCEDRRKR